MIYHVQVSREEGVFIGRVLERAGVTTEGKTLDELVAMLRDAIATMWDDRDVQFELIIPPDVDLGLAPSVAADSASAA